MTSICAAYMVTGAIIAGTEGFDDNAFGYFLVICNNFSQSIYTVITNKYNKDKAITPFEINFFFAVLGFPMCMVCTHIQGESGVLYDILFNPETREFWQALAVTVSGISGIFITICSLLTVTVCGPSALNVAGSLKDVALTYLGFILFKDAVIST